jgi:hypothetical protein
VLVSRGVTALHDDSTDAKMTAMPALRATSLAHVRPVVPLRFPAEEPEDEHLGQSKRHLELCAALYEMLSRVVGKDDAIGADQFVYFDAADPRRCVAPDAFVKRGVKDWSFDTWKTWENGAPDVAFEILSPSDTPERWTFRDKLRRYRALGVRELIVADLDAPEGERLRAWERIGDRFVERRVKKERTPCVTLGVHVLTGRVGKHDVGVRLAYDRAGRRLVPTRAEAELAAKEAELASKEAERAAREAERDAREEARAATARVAELERQLKKRRKK